MFINSYLCYLFCTYSRLISNYLYFISCSSSALRCITSALSFMFMKLIKLVPCCCGNLTVACPVSYSLLISLSPCAYINKPYVDSMDFYAIKIKLSFVVSFDKPFYILNIYNSVVYNIL